MLVGAGSDYRCWLEQVLITDISEPGMIWTARASRTEGSTRCQGVFCI
jgi:hypothetical protein